MSTVDYIPNSTGGGALLMSQSDYVTAAPTGVVPGLAASRFQNKTVRQSSMVAAAVANFVSATLGIDVLDDGNISALITNLTAAIEVASASGLALGMNAPTNLRIAATEGSNNLTIALKGTNGSDPSATNPITIPFRDPTIATGDLVLRQVTAALSFTINSGSTMGVVNINQPFKLWVVAFDNGGTVCLGAINCSTATQVFPLNEDAPQTSQSGTIGGNTAGLFYANVSAIAAKSIRILGYIEFGNGLTNVGVWATTFTKIQLYGPGQAKPGQVVQTLSATSTTTSTNTSTAALPGAALSPAVTQSPTLTSSANLVAVSISGTGQSGAALGQFQLVRGATAIGAATALGGGSGAATPTTLFALDLPGSTTPTYSLFGRSNSAATITWAPSATVTTGYVWKIEEIMG